MQHAPNIWQNEASYICLAFITVPFHKLKPITWWIKFFFFNSHTLILGYGKQKAFSITTLPFLSDVSSPYYVLKAAMKKNQGVPVIAKYQWSTLRQLTTRPIQHNKISLDPPWAWLFTDALMCTHTHTPTRKQKRNHIKHDYMHVLIRYMSRDIFVPGSAVVYCTITNQRYSERNHIRETLGVSEVQVLKACSLVDYDMP